ncbi:MAG: PhzF family phenazine biosynthesis protein [Chloroflexota bacterium]
MAFPIFQVDAFTHIPFRGNPAAVVIMDKMQPEDWMQKVAAEMNLSETAFVAPNQDPFKRVWQLKWFTPATEVELCGHATVAASHILYSEGYLKPNETARFETLSGELRSSKDSGSWIELDFPTSEISKYEISNNEAEATLGSKPSHAMQARFDQEFDIIFELESEQELRQSNPDMAQIANLGSRGVCITCKADPDTEGNPDFISRFFAPNVGINEDPVTGSAHCYLTKYWAEKLGKNNLIAHQVSQRGGTLKVTWDGERTKIAGRAVTIFKGSLLK